MTVWIKNNKKLRSRILKYKIMKIKFNHFKINIKVKILNMNNKIKNCNIILIICKEKNKTYSKN